MFDGWRLQQFAEPIGLRTTAPDELVLAMRSDDRFVETTPGWFALTLLTGAG